MNAAYATFVACGAARGGFLFGFDRALINGAGPGIQAIFIALLSDDLLGPNGRMLPVVWVWACETRGRTSEDM
jgi:hypothetical protein